MKIRELVKESIPYFIAVSILLADIILYCGLIKIFFNGDETIIAGVIAFIGAVIGGAITFIGVRLTIKEGRRKEERRFIRESLDKLDDVGRFLSILEINIESSVEEKKRIETFINEIYDFVLKESPSSGLRIIDLNLSQVFIKVLIPIETYKRFGYLENIKSFNIEFYHDIIISIQNCRDRLVELEEKFIFNLSTLK